MLSLITKCTTIFLNHVPLKNNHGNTMTRETMGVAEPPGLGNSHLVFGDRKKGTVQLTYGSLILLAAIFLCTIVGTGLAVYNFAACPRMDPLSEVSLEGNSTFCALFSTTTIANDIDISTDEPAKKIDVRLPKIIVPVAYNVAVVPFITEGNFTFNGEVHITIKVLENTDTITLNINDIKVDEPSVAVRRLVENDKVEDLIVESQTEDKDRQFYVLKLNGLLEADEKYVVYIKYVGVLNDYMQGFYRSSYMAGNVTRWLAATQFQATDARRAFPCFDEPGLKARFTINVARPLNYSSISNMPKRNIVSEPVENLPGYVWDHYEESVPMSTYLVAFVVSDLANKSNGNFTVWARKEAITSTNYALDVGPRLLKYFEEYFGIRYPLPKLDMIALPDFSAGAMENWGLITYRETAMLFEEGVSSSTFRERVATVVAHELAHQWFGNLVTPFWWTDLWLNEGFATYVEYIGLEAVEPSWRSMEQFVALDLQSVMSLDALSSSHPVSVVVHNPDEVDEIFDRISYAKGAAIIRMMDHFLTNEVFRQGLNDYLESRKYQAAEQDDLWEALTKAGKKARVLPEGTTVKDIMDTWTLQTGFPVVHVDRDYDKFSVSFSQIRFMHLASERKTSKQVWKVPITYTTSEVLDFNTTKAQHWLNGRSLKVEVPSLSSNQWLIVNIQETGFYRVNYDRQNWRLISQHLLDPDRFTQISATNRAQLLDDALNLARADLLDYTTALEITRYLVHEREYVPWKAAINAITMIGDMLGKTGDYGYYKKYLVQLLRPTYLEIGFKEVPGENLLTVYKRLEIYSLACDFGLEDCLKHCVTLFENWKNTPNPDRDNPISANMKRLVYCTAISVGGEDHWDFAWERYLKATVSSEKEIILSALGCTRITWLLARYLDRAMTEEHGIRKQDLYRVFGSVSDNVIGQPLVFTYIRQHWEKLKKYLGSTLTNLQGILKIATSNINTKYELDELRRFGHIHRADLGRAIDQAVERAEGNIAWMDRNYAAIVNWLKKVERT